jgi:RNA polymerase-binding transcription factor DksA
VTPEDRLREAREIALARVAALRRDLRAVLDSASSTTGDDEHDPEGATIGFERAQAAALLAGAEAQVAEIDAALARLSDGSYGVCADCGGAIGAERLEARPSAVRCVRCAGSRR